MNRRRRKWPARVFQTSWLGVCHSTCVLFPKWNNTIRKQGTGYHVAYLADQLRQILHVDRAWDVALVGVGHLGRAIANYGGFLDRGFRIVAVYDNDAEKIGTRVGGHEVQDSAKMEADIRGREIRIAMLAVPASAAQKAAEQLVNAGIRSILCYVPTSIITPDSVYVQYIDPVLHMQHMTYYLG
jgi:redox-sensing transcriptional repressor